MKTLVAGSPTSNPASKPADPYNLRKLSDDELVVLVNNLNAQVAACMAEVKRRLADEKQPIGDWHY